MKLGTCAHPSRCGSDGIRCSWLDCGWAAEGHARGWPPPKSTLPADYYVDSGVSPWLLAAVLVIIALCVVAIYAGLRMAG